MKRKVSFRNNVTMKAQNATRVVRQLTPLFLTFFVIGMATAAGHAVGERLTR